MVQVFGVYSHNPKICSLCMLSWIEQKISKTRKLVLLFCSIVQPLQLNDDRKTKGEESYRASAVLYTYRFTSWDVYIILTCVHYTYMYIQYTGGLSMQRIACNANQTDCNSVMPYGIIIFYIPQYIACFVILRKTVRMWLILWYHSRWLVQCKTGSLNPLLNGWWNMVECV